MEPGAIVLKYVEQVCGKIRADDARGNFREELLDHIAQSVENLMEERGLSQEDAETETIVRMGSPDMLVQEMNTVHKGNSPLLLVLRTIFLTLTAVFAIWNAYVWGSAYLNGYLPAGANFFTPEPMMRTSGCPSDTRPFFWIPLIVSALLFIIPAVRQAYEKHGHRVHHV